jgi:hypothetical protein
MYTVTPVPMSIILFLLATLSSVTATISNCGSNPAFTITTLDQSPLTKVSAGQNVSLTLKYTSYAPVSAGTVTTAVTYNFIPFKPTVDDLCKSIACPLAPGDHDGSTSVVTPTGISGTVVSTITWADSNGNQLLCIKSTLSVSR